MSTYLIAFVISDFDVNSKTNANNILFRVFSRPEQIQNSEFGLDTAAKALELFESAFETKYELLKLDQVAFPVFSRGAMQNYGIMFYREDYLLNDPLVSTQNTSSKILFKPPVLLETALIRVYCFVVIRV